MKTNSPEEETVGERWDLQSLLRNMSSEKLSNGKKGMQGMGRLGFMWLSNTVKNLR